MSVFSRLSLISRRKKIKLFYDLMKPTAESRVLDLGGEINPHGDRGLQLIDSYPWWQNLYAINIDEHAIDEIRNHYPDVKAQVASACDIPWPDKYFDMVYCNAVVEHVGDFNAQKKMAAEVMRVAKR
jgi:ubiquinone/menaquinone biosynthesis C-methylase UbiE